MAHAHAAHDEHHAHVHIPTEGAFDFTNGKFAMWLFLISDAMAFIGFLGAYMILRMTATSGAVEGGLPWQPPWMLPMDLVLTGLNTFVLICSSVTMVKALSAIQDGNVARLKLFLALTMLGGTFFVGFQVYEWRHFIHEGITAQGLVVPDLETAMERAGRSGQKVTRYAMARTLFGGRDLDRPPEGKTRADFEKGDFTEAEYLSLPLLVMDEEHRDMRPSAPGVIQHVTYGVPATRNQPLVLGKELSAELEDAAPEERGQLLARQRELRPRVASGFAATFFLLTGFHGLHVLIGVIYLGVVLFRASRGAFTRDHNSPVEIAGLYWHFVDLVWVLLFMVIYLIT
jgi:cytochrome c oxidase subunit 3